MQSSETNANLAPSISINSLDVPLLGKLRAEDNHSS
jgi:hypothetical protein